MREINVLFGFKNKKTEDSIVKELQALGWAVNGEMRFRKHMIKEYIQEHPELDAVILKEYLDGGERYGTQELVELADDSNLNIVVVLRNSHRGHDMMRELYNAGILNAYFTSGNRGANPEKLVELMVNPRTRRQARAYYRIEEKPLHKEILSHEEFRDCYMYLTNEDEGINIIDRFTAVSRWLTPQQMGVFVTTLPDDVLDVLKQYQEFYKIHAQLYKRRYVREPYKMPKDAEQALSPQVLARALVEEAEREPETEMPDPQPVTIRMVNHLPVPPELDKEEEARRLRQEVSPVRKYMGKKKEAVDDDIYDVADRKRSKEVKPLFDFIEKFNKKPQINLNFKGGKKKGKVTELEIARMSDDETAESFDQVPVSAAGESIEAEIGEKSADELMEMFGS